MVIRQMQYIEKNYQEKVWEEISSSHEQVQVLLRIASREDSIYAALDSKDRG